MDTKESRQTKAPEAELMRRTEAGRPEVGLTGQPADA